MRVLVTNDDGIDAVGIQRPALALSRDDRFEVLVVSPDHVTLDQYGHGCRPSTRPSRRVSKPPLSKLPRTFADSSRSQRCRDRLLDL